MRLTLNPDQTFNLLGSSIKLLRARPLVNGALVERVATRVEQNDPNHWRVRYRTPHGSFWVQALQEGPVWRLRYGLEELPQHFTLDALGLCFEVEGAQKYLRQGYHSWDGAAYVALGGAPQTGYALTQLLPALGTGSLVLGFERHDRFQHTFTFAGPTLCIQTLWDRKKAGRIESETLLVFEHAGVEEALREWARRVAQAAPFPPRIPAQPITGWCSWYHLYAAISEQNILEHLRGVEAVARREHLPMQVFQLDDGFTPEMGDWLLVKPQFPRGLKPVLEEIRAAGFRPGLWIAPFTVGNRSQLYRQHPDWVLRERETGQPLVQMRFYGEFRWHKRSEEYYILDATHPEAFEYLRRVFRTWRHDWGCEYFKTDFMFWGAEYGPDRAAYHTPGLSRMEVWHRVARMIREEIGEALWMGCGMPLWASVGLVEGNRTGRDVGAEWLPDALERLHGLALRNFANHLLWEADPDCVLLRERYHHLRPDEQTALALFAGMMGGALLTSDALEELSPERLALWRMLLNAAAGSCRFPLLGREDQVLVQVRGQRPAAVLAFNPSQETVQRTYDLLELGLPAPLPGYHWHRQEFLPPQKQLSLHLAPHEGALIFLGDPPIPTQLP
ncbi:MAG: alpha-galactosidase [Meiothermus sp.]|uniref:glycoside hydrolase family 36 protein n=1 Tax=Meiothermus sp. TaxID=1955249 RepID=UPI00298F11AD|nr:glycoside hydrolase family 36 protein [Meiothermus sp.]MDW8425243.1 alpha-galactosidase [Meiothermus sp.]